MNRYEVIGRLGKEPEIKMVGENKVASFSVATSEKHKDKATGEIKEETEWHNVVIWGKVAEVVEKYVKKGDLIYVSGKHKTRSWEKDGVKKFASELLADKIEMLGSKGGSNEPQNTDQNDQIDSLPF
jgi:single-strand DNA-binding protein